MSTNNSTTRNQIVDFSQPLVGEPSTPAPDRLLAGTPCQLVSNYFTDATENKKYSGLRDSAGAWLAQGDSKFYAPGDQQAMWMKFPAPPETSTRVTFVFAGFPPFEDVPVAP